MIKSISMRIGMTTWYDITTLYSITSEIPVMYQFIPEASASWHIDGYGVNPQGDVHQNI